MSVSPPAGEKPTLPLETLSGNGKVVKWFPLFPGEGSAAEAAYDAEDVLRRSVEVACWIGSYCWLAFSVLARARVVWTGDSDAKAMHERVAC